MENLSVVLKKLRENKSFTIEELAKKAGLGKGTVGDIETGKSKSTVKTLNKIAIALELTPEEKNELDSAFLGRKILTEPKLTKRERLQKDEFMKQATLMFNDETISEEDKEKLLASLQEAFYIAKLLNKKDK